MSAHAARARPVPRTALLAALGTAAGAALFVAARAVGFVGGPAEAAPPASVLVPAGMVYVPGGTTHVGAEDGAPAERPVFVAHVRPFFMDARLVTVAEFRRFVQATGYRTTAERLGDAGVYDPAADEWRLVRGATWHHPLGPDSAAAPGDHPVTQVSWHDADAYARWAGKRLPTEVEWEHAARGARDSRERYAWGGSLVSRERHHANTWQGTPRANRGEDGWVNTSPVGAFGRTRLGLTDMGGNVWQWTADWFRAYADRDRPFTPTSATERVLRGGSFLCREDFCHGYRVSARSGATPETALYHTGFRLVRDLPRAASGP